MRTLLARYDGRDRETWALAIIANQYNSGSRFDNLGRPREAVEELQSARADCHSALREFGPDRQFRGFLARIEGHLCRALSIVGRRDEAIAAGRRAIELGKDLVREPLPR